MIFVKRPLTVSGFALGAGAFAASLFDIKIALFLCALCIVVFTLTLIIRHFRNAFAAVTLIFLSLGLLLGSLAFQNIQSDTDRLMRNEQIENAEFTPEKKVSTSQAIGQLVLSSGESFTVLVTGARLEPYKVYTISGTPEEIVGQYRNYYYSHGAIVQILPEVVTGTGRTGGNPLFYSAYEIQNACSHQLYSYLPQKEASIIDTLLLGNKAALDTALKNSFSISGAAHIAVVSGMHLSVISSMVFSLLYFITGKRRLSGGLSIIAVICFMLISGFSLSVIRAGIMCIVMLSGCLFSRKADSLNSLGFAVLLITLFSPLSILDVGFQLSVVSTLGIITLVPYIVDSCKRYFRSRLAVKLLITPVVMSLSACIATAPIIALNFKYIGIYFIITNLLLTVAVPLLLIFSLLFVIFSFVPLCEFLAFPLGLISGLLARFNAFVVNGISSLPYARLDFDMPYIEVVVGVLLLVCAIIIFAKRTRRSALIAGFGAILTFSIILSVFSIISADNATLSLISTGGGITAIFEKSGESAVIACGGTAGRYTVQSELSESVNTNILTVKGGTKECGGMFSAVRSSILSERYFVQDESANKQLLGTLDSDSISVYSDTAQIRLWDKYTLTLIPLKKSTAAVIELPQEGYILILPNPEYTDMLPEEYKSPSLLITTQPLDSSVINADNTIIACSKTNDIKYKGQGIYNDNTLSLSHNRKISISINDKIQYIKRGE